MEVGGSPWEKPGLYLFQVIDVENWPDILSLLIRSTIATSAGHGWEVNTDWSHSERKVWSINEEVEGKGDLVFPESGDSGDSCDTGPGWSDTLVSICMGRYQTPQSS